MCTSLLGCSLGLFFKDQSFKGHNLWLTSPSECFMVVSRSPIELYRSVIIELWMWKLFFQTLLSDELVFEWAVDPWLCLRIVFLLMAECYLFFATPVRTFIPKKDYCGAHPRLHIFAQFNFAKMFSGGTFFNGLFIGMARTWVQLTQMSVILCLTKSAIA